jgi:oxygen-independent coproporphyrinogen-3 oxidase
VRKLIGVRGTSESVIDSLKIVKNYYKNYNVDLIYNLPGQTLESFTADLNTVLGEIDAPHMTINPFVLLRNAQLFKEMERGKIPFPNQELEMEMFHDSLDIIARFGRKHYSVRDFCKPGNECKYILNNAYCNDVLAFGAGAYGFLNGMVYQNAGTPDEYISLIEANAHSIDNFNICTDEDLLKRYMLMSLRLTETDLSRCPEINGITAFELYKEALIQLEREQFISLEQHILTFKPLGLFWGNNIRGEFTEGNELDYIGYGLKGAGKVGRGNYI